MPAVCERLRSFAEQSGELPALVDARRYLQEEPPSIEPVIPGILDMADKSFVVGPSKCRKSFFVLQTALCIASGRPLLIWEIPQPKRVTIVQYELKEAHYWRRVRRMAEGLDITSDDLKGRLRVFNGRGFRPSVNDMQIADTDVVILRCDAAVCDFRFAVAEFDDLPRAEQLAFWWGIVFLGLFDIAALIDSGGKSLHAWLRVDRPNRDAWQRDIEQELFGQWLAPMGVDQACRNESRLSRLPGHYRTASGNRQRLLYLAR